MRNLVNRSDSGSLYWKSDTPAEKIQEIRVSHESGRVNLWVNDMLQYLTASEAMAFADAFERGAIAALKYESQI